MAKEWRSGNLVHRSSSRPRGEKDLILKSKDKGRSSEANGGEAYALVYGERAGLSEGVGDHCLFILFSSLISSQDC